MIDKTILDDLCDLFRVFPSLLRAVVSIHYLEDIYQILNELIFTQQSSPISPRLCFITPILYFITENILLYLYKKMYNFQLFKKNLILLLTSWSVSPLPPPRSWAPSPVCLRTPPPPPGCPHPRSSQLSPSTFIERVKWELEIFISVPQMKTGPDMVCCMNFSVIL